MKTRYIFLKGLLCILFPVLGSVQALGNNNTYYAQVTATAIGPTGAGTVYATSNAQNGQQGATSTAVGTSNNGGGNVAFTFTATPSSDIYEFKGWSTSNNVNATTVSENNPYTANYQASNNAGQNNIRSHNIYAIFVEKPIFYFSATATVTTSGAGTATVSPATTSVRGEHWNSTSATTSGIAFSATPNSDYGFIGWSETAIQVSRQRQHQLLSMLISPRIQSPTPSVLQELTMNIPRMNLQILQLLRLMRMVELLVSQSAQPLSRSNLSKATILPLQPALVFQ